MDKTNGFLVSQTLKRNYENLDQYFKERLLADGSDFDERHLNVQVNSAIGAPR